MSAPCWGVPCGSPTGRICAKRRPTGMIGWPCGNDFLAAAGAFGPAGTISGPLPGRLALGERFPGRFVLCGNDFWPHLTGMALWERLAGPAGTGIRPIPVHAGDFRDFESFPQGHGLPAPPKIVPLGDIFPLKSFPQGQFRRARAFLGTNVAPRPVTGRISASGGRAVAQIALLAQSQGASLPARSAGWHECSSPPSHEAHLCHFPARMRLPAQSRGASVPFSGTNAAPRPVTRRISASGGRAVARMRLPGRPPGESLPAARVTRLGWFPHSERSGVMLVKRRRSERGAPPKAFPLRPARSPCTDSCTQGLPA